MKFKFLPAIAIAALAITSCDPETITETITNTVVTDEAVEALNNADFVLELLHYADVDGDEELALSNINEFATLATYFKNENHYSENTLVVTSGDIIIPGPRYSAAEETVIRNLTGSNEPGHVDIYFANQIGVDAAAVGNHELDQGPGEFADAISSETRNDVTFPGSTFPFLATNIDFSGESDFTIATDGDETSNMGQSVAKYAIKTFNGEKIGIVGASAPSFPTITSTGNLVFTPGTSYTNAELAAEIQTSVDALTAAGVNKIVLLSHMQQISIEKAVAELLTDVDIIVAGGSNTRMGDDNDVLHAQDSSFDEGYPYSTTDANENPTLVVNVDGDYKYLGRLMVAFDEDGIIIEDSLSSVLNGVYAANSDNVDIIVDEVVGIIDEQYSNIVGYSTVFLDGRRSQVRTQETNLGNLTADANLWYANLLSEETVDISIKNGGGIRALIGLIEVEPDGTTNLLPTTDNSVSEGHLRATMKFDNGLVRLTVTPEELVDIMEHAVAGTEDGATPGQFPQISGMKIEYDPSQTARSVDENETVTAGERIRSLIVTGENGTDNITVVSNGVLQTANVPATFNLVTLNFLANGGDDYPFTDNDLSISNRTNFYEGSGFGDLEDYQDATLANDPSNQNDFSYTGGEQDALAEYFLSFYATEDSAFAIEETDAENDTRIVLAN